MKATVKSKNRIYETPVFAVLSKKAGSKIICFNEDESTLCVKRVFRLPFRLWRQVEFSDVSRGGFVKSKKLTGFDWIISDQKLLRSIKRGKPLSPALINRCKKLLNATVKHEWCKISLASDAADLHDAAFGFSGAFVSSVIKNKNTAEIAFDTAGKRFCLLLENAFISPEFTVGKELYYAECFMQSGRFCLAENAHAKSLADIGENCAHIFGDRVFWREVSLC